MNLQILLNYQGENRIFDNIVLLTRQNWFYETTKKPAYLNTSICIS